jgi:hypothetical protein
MQIVLGMLEYTNTVLPATGKRRNNLNRSSSLAALLVVCGYIGTSSLAGELTAAGEKVTVTRLPPGAQKTAEALIGYMRIVNQSYPGPAAPRRPRFHRIVAVSVTGEIRISDGRTVRLSGLVCGPALQKMIEPFHGDKGWWIVYDVNGAEKNHSVPSAYVWSSINQDDRPHAHDGLSSINDQAALNGWCSPDVRMTGAMFERYKALADAQKILKMPTTQRKSTDR